MLTTMPSQTFDAMLRNRVYIGLIDVAACGIATRGDFEPLITEKVSVIVERVATRHLGLEQAREEFRNAVASVEEFDQRDATESAHRHVRSVTEEAYFYAGLAFGVTLSPAE
jgi:hypothetical protein